MKRLLLVLSALLLTALFPIHALALDGDETVTIQIGSASAENGATVDIPVSLQNSVSVDSIQFDLNYDSTALSVVSVTPGDLFLPEYVIYNADEPGRLRIACADKLGLTGDGTLLIVRFLALSNAGSALTATSGIITRVDADYNQTNAYIALESGGVSIGAGAVPEALVTPWIPETPVPTATPEPSATPEPAEEAAIIVSSTPEAQLSAEPAKTDVEPIAYVVVGVLFALLIVLITVSVIRRRNQAEVETQPKKSSRKDSIE